MVNTFGSNPNSVAPSDLAPTRKSLQHSYSTCETCIASYVLPRRVSFQRSQSLHHKVVQATATASAVKSKPVPHRFLERPKDVRDQGAVTGRSSNGLGIVGRAGRQLVGQVVARLLHGAGQQGKKRGQQRNLSQIRA